MFNILKLCVCALVLRIDLNLLDSSPCVIMYEEKNGLAIARNSLNKFAYLDQTPYRPRRLQSLSSTKCWHHCRCRSQLQLEPLRRFQRQRGRRPCLWARNIKRADYRSKSLQSEPRALATAWLPTSLCQKKDKKQYESKWNNWRKHGKMSTYLGTRRVQWEPVHCRVWNESQWIKSVLCRTQVRIQSY